MSTVSDVVAVVARALTTKPDAVQVIESQHKGTTLVELYVAPGEQAHECGSERLGC